MTVLLAFIGLIVGALIPFQAIINARLGQQLTGPWAASWVNFAVGGIALTLVMLATGQFPGTMKALPHAPWPLLTGGIFGALFVLCGAVLIPRIGAAGLVSVMVAGQLVMSVLLDHFGWFGVPVRQADWTRLTGVIMLFAGAMVVLFTKKV